MGNINFLENLPTRLGQTATVKNVYGEPVVAGDKIIIPVAQIMYGFGGGYGQGQKPKKFQSQENISVQSDEKKNSGEGLGGGGGIVAKPKGVYEISSKCTKFIPANNTRLLIAMLLTGFVIRGLMQHRLIKK
jgi:uncharacterized spore protein YtfJ